MAKLFHVTMYVDEVRWCGMRDVKAETPQEAEEGCIRKLKPGMTRDVVIKAVASEKGFVVAGANNGR